MKIVTVVPLVIAVAAIGYGAGIYRSASTAVTREAPTARPPVEAPFSRADIAAVVRGELAQLPRTAPMPAAAASAAPASQPAGDRAEAPTPASKPGARARADTIVSDAIHFASWTEHDRLLLREQLAQLNKEDALAVTRALAVAINDGKVRVDTEGIPF